MKKEQTPSTYRRFFLWDNVFFVLSAFVVAGTFISFTRMETDYVAITGWLMSLFWLFVARGWRGAAKTYKESNEHYLKSIFYYEQALREQGIIKEETPKEQKTMGS